MFTTTIKNKKTIAFLDTINNDIKNWISKEVEIIETVYKAVLYINFWKPIIINNRGFKNNDWTYNIEFYYDRVLLW